MNASTSPVLITGVGVVAPGGLGLEAFWEGSLEGRCAISPITRFDATSYPAHLAGQVLDFDAAELLPSRLLPQTDISTRFALVAAEWALRDAKVDPADMTDYDMGVVTSNASGGFEFTHREFRKLWTVGSQAVSVYESFAWFYAVNTGQISIRHGLRGPSSAIVAEQAGGLDALGHARRTIRRGTPFVVSGGVDSALDPWGWVSQLSSGLVSTNPDPATAYRPFDATADGYVPGEGGAILVLEDAAAARARGVHQVYGEIAGHASTFDPPPGSGGPSGLRRAIEIALDDAGAQPQDVDLVVADGAGNPAADLDEARALAAVFGPGAVAVTAPKSRYGRVYAGGGPLDVVTALMAMKENVIPPTIGVGDLPGGYEIDLVRGQARPARVSCALVLARGRWGFNSAVVLRGH